MSEPDGATPEIATANAGVAEGLPFSDDSDFLDAERGFVAALTPGVVTGD